MTAIPANCLPEAALRGQQDSALLVPMTALLLSWQQSSMMSEAVKVLLLPWLTRNSSRRVFYRRGISVQAVIQASARSTQNPEMASNVPVGC